MQFKVPQFLDIEDKLFGDFTFRQFMYLAGGGAICFVIYKWLGLLLAIIPILALGGFSLMLAFYRPNSKPFINLLENGFKYTIQDKLYIWKRRKNTKNKEEASKVVATTINRDDVRLGNSKLRDLSWGLDVLDYKKEEK